MKRFTLFRNTKDILKFGAVILCIISTNARSEAVLDKADIVKFMSSGIKSNEKFDTKTYVDSCRKIKKNSFWCNICKATVKISSHGTFFSHYSSSGETLSIKIIRNNNSVQKFRINNARRTNNIKIKGLPYKLTRNKEAKYNWDEFSVKNHDGPKIFELAKSWCKKHLK